MREKAVAKEARRETPSTFGASVHGEERYATAKLPKSESTLQLLLILQVSRHRTLTVHKQDRSLADDGIARISIVVIRLGFAARRSDLPKQPAEQERSNARLRDELCHALVIFLLSYRRSRDILLFQNSSKRFSTRSE